MNRLGDNFGQMTLLKVFPGKFNLDHRQKRT